MFVFFQILKQSANIVIFFQSSNKRDHFSLKYAIFHHIIVDYRKNIFNFARLNKIEITNNIIFLEYARDYSRINVQH